MAKSKSQKGAAKEREPYTQPYTKSEKRAVWRKGRIMSDMKASKWRMDAFGNLIRFDDYGNRDSFFGWEVDHIVRVSDGGTNIIFNLRPLQWKANVKRN